MKAVIIIFSLALLSACASYNYPVYDAGDGVYYASSPPNYIYADSYLGYSYYSPYFYPYRFSVWYSPWYRPYYGAYWPGYHWCPPYHSRHYHTPVVNRGYGDRYTGVIHPDIPPGPLTPPPEINRDLLRSTDDLSLIRERMRRGAPLLAPGGSAGNRTVYGGSSANRSSTSAGSARSSLPTSSRPTATSRAVSRSTSRSSRSRSVSARKPSLHDQ